MSRWCHPCVATHCELWGIRYPHVYLPTVKTLWLWHIHNLLSATRLKQRIHSSTSRMNWSFTNFSFSRLTAPLYLRLLAWLPGISLWRSMERMSRPTDTRWAQPSSSDYSGDINTDSHISGGPGHDSEVRQQLDNHDKKVGGDDRHFLHSHWFTC